MIFGRLGGGTVKEAGYGAVAFLAMASALSAQGRDREVGRPAPAPTIHRASSASLGTFQQYCVVCHGGDRPQAGLSLARLTERMAPADVGEHADAWQKVAEMLETRQMPPAGMPAPADAERAAVLSWIRTSLDEYDAGHGGDHGRVTVRRLTSGEYAYAVRDLTGVSVKVGVDASSDSVGGEGFT
jgi:mono/diheme cytochrome c family protein